MSNGRLQMALLALSTGLFFGWQFCLFPPVGSPVLSGTLLGMAETPLAQSCVVATNALACTALVFAAPRISRLSCSACFMVASSAAQLAVFALLVFAPVGVTKAVAVGVIAGMGVALGWVCLILQYARVDVAVMEGAFVWSLPLAAASFLLPRILSWAVVLVVLGACAIVVAVVCLLNESTMPVEEGVARAAPWTVRRLVREDAAALRTLARCFVAYVCISICKPALDSQGEFVSEWSWALYALGFIAASFLLWLFVNTSPGVGLYALVRFLFPVLSLGVLLGTGGSQLAVAAGILLLSACHASFELANRGVVVALMRLGPDRRALYGMAGLCVIGFGSLVGVLLYSVIGTVWPHGGATASLAVVVFLLVLFFVEPSRGSLPVKDADSPERQSSGSNLEEHRGAFAARHGLTRRETEVLSYILDGRSHPFIRDELGISKGTVDTHVRHIYQKCGVSSRQDLISLVMDESAG